MQRAIETSNHVTNAYGCSVRTDDRLREIGNNRFDHIPWPEDAFPIEYADFWASDRPFLSITHPDESGESWMHFKTRVGAFVEDVVSNYRDKTVMVVCHGGVIEAIIDHVFNIGPWRGCEVWISNTGISHLEFTGPPARQKWIIHYVNRLDHLGQTPSDI